MTKKKADMFIRGKRQTVPFLIRIDPQLKDRAVKKAKSITPKVSLNALIEGAIQKFLDDLSQ